jgi:hypothetical protein
VVQPFFVVGSGQLAVGSGRFYFVLAKMLVIWGQEAVFLSFAPVPMLAI